MFDVEAAVAAREQAEREEKIRAARFFEEHKAQAAATAEAYRTSIERNRAQAEAKRQADAERIANAEAKYSAASEERRIAVAIYEHAQREQRPAGEKARRVDAPKADVIAWTNACIATNAARRKLAAAEIAEQDARAELRNARRAAEQV